MNIRKEIIPAVLTDDFKTLQKQLNILAGLTHWVSIDIMDGIFVPQKTISVEDLKKIDSIIDTEIHLMTVHPERELDTANEAGVKRVVFHIEATQDPNSVLQEIAARGMKKGIAISPETSIEKIMPHADNADMVTFLSVHPGKAGQKMISRILTKIRKFKLAKPDVPVEIDGGITLETIEDAKAAGVDLFVANSAIFGEPNAEEAIKNLRAKIQE
ncbi:ribulose-phosphate 3-epimerase [Patescibacteria group bacterium]